jgi:hypothetical protein
MWEKFMTTGDRRWTRQIYGKSGPLATTGFPNCQVLHMGQSRVVSSKSPPAVGAPPPLIEGKTYGFGGPNDNANGGSIWFTIQNGKSVEVPQPGGSP